MADGTILNPGLGGDKIWTEDTGNPNGKIPRSKLTLGDVDSDDGDISATNPMPVAGAVTQSGTWTSVPIASASQTGLSGKVVSNAGGSSFSTVKGSAGRLYGWQMVNTNSSGCYVQVFDATSPTVGTTAPTLSLYVPPVGGIDAYLTVPVSFTIGITLSATTTQTGSTAPSAAININALYL